MSAPARLRSDLLVANLREIARALSAAWDVATTLDLIARKTALVMQVDSCSIYLLDDAREKLWLRASTGLATRSVGRVSLDFGQGLTGWAAEHSQPVAARQAQTDPRFHWLPLTHEQNFQSLLAVPLVNRDRVIGAMNVQTRDLHDFAPDEIELASLISDLAAGAIDRALTYDHMNRQIAELTTLAQVSQAVTSPLFLEEMLDLIVEMAAKVMGAPVCALHLLDAESGELRLHAGRRAGSAYRNKAPLKLDEGITGQVIRERRPIAVDDVQADPRFRYADVARAEGLISMLSVPLIVRDRAIGAFNAYTTERHRFNAEETALFSTLANQTALAIENAQLATHAAIVREMHHRIRNNLQTIAMLLRLQAAESRELSAAEVLHTSINRIHTIAAVHDTLASGGGLRSVDVRAVLEKIAQLLAPAMLRPGLTASVTVEGESLRLPSRAATSLALAINELVQNALEHGFVGRAAGQVAVRVTREPDACLVEVADDGVGLPAAPPASLGLELVNTLVRDDLRGTVAFHPSPAGTRVTVRFPMPGG